MNKLTLAAFLLPGLLVAAPLKRAEFTRVINDVKMLPEQSPPQTAKIGDVVQGRTSVTTGAQSRAELRFEDKSLTRLGANSVFNLEQGTRTVDLKQGVMLMQVPKQMGGAKIRTAAVTAAVTGTTLMVEYEPNGFVKIIVLEGEVDVFLNDKPNVFRTLNPGDMIIMKPDGKFIPEPVQVDLARLKKTSKLTDEHEFGLLGNEKHLRDADNNQARDMRRGNLAPTNLMLPGRGRSLMVKLDEFGHDRIHNLQIAGRPNPGPGAGPDGPGGPPSSASKYGRPQRLGGVAVIDNTTVIVTDPRIVTHFNGTLATGQGKIFRPEIDGSLGRALFDKPTQRFGTGDLGPVPAIDKEMRSAGEWAGFSFEELHIIGAPRVKTKGGPTNLLLASRSDVVLSDSDPYNPSNINVGNWDLDTSGLKNVMIAAQNNIDWKPSFSLSGSTQNVTLYTQVQTTSTTPSESSGDISMQGSQLVTLPEGKFEANAAGNLTIGGTTGTSPAPTVSTIRVVPTIQAAQVNLNANGNITIATGAKIEGDTQIKAHATGSITVQDSTALRRLTTMSPTEIALIAESGNVSLNGGIAAPVVMDGQSILLQSTNGSVSINNSILSADLLRVRTLSPNGTLTIGNSTLTAAQGMKLYAEGSNGAVLFVGNTNLNGPTIIAGHTVQVNSGVTVNVNRPDSFHVHSDVSNYNTPGYGNFSTGGSSLIFVPDGTTGPHKHNFSSRPGF